MQELATKVNNGPNYDTFKKINPFFCSIHSVLGLMIFKKISKNGDLFTNAVSIVLKKVNFYPAEIRFKIFDLQHHFILKSKYKELISTASDPILNVGNLYRYKIFQIYILGCIVAIWL